MYVFVEINMKCFLANSTKRIFPVCSGDNINFYDIYTAKNESFSYQVCIYNDSVTPLEIEINISSKLEHSIRLEQLINFDRFTPGTDASELDGVGILPGLVPDPLLNLQNVMIPPFSNRVFFVRVLVPKDAKTGKGIDLIDIKNGDEKIQIECPYFIADFVVGKKKVLPMLHWFYADAICDYYKVEPFSDDFWTICEKYMKDYADHGNTVIYLPLFTPPLDGIKRPTQLLNVKRLDENTYDFDYRNVTKWIKLANKVGIYNFECVHLFTQWGCAHPVRIYTDPQDENTVIFDPESSATGDEYRIFLTQLLTSFKAYTEENGIYDKIYYHMSDEPHGEDQLRNYKAARVMLKEIAPWIKVMDALSDTEFVTEAGVDMPIASIGTADKFLEQNIPHWVYFCCGPRGNYINRFMDTPLHKVRILGTAMYRLNALGFLHWGYNYWYKIGTRELLDVYTSAYCAEYPNITMGDSFLVYPSPDGPVDSLRSEIFFDSIEDYDLLANMGIDKASDVISEITSYKDFPRDEDFIYNLRKKLLEEYI